VKSARWHLAWLSPPNCFNSFFEQHAVRQKIKESLMTIAEYSFQEGSALNAGDGFDNDKRWQFALVAPDLRRALRSAI